MGQRRVSFGKLIDFYAHGFQHIDGVPFPVAVPVHYLLDVAQVDQALGAGGAGQVGDKYVLLRLPRGVAVDHRVFFRVQAATVAGFFPVAGVGQARGVAVVADGQYLAVVGGGDDRADGQARAGGAQRDGFGELHVDFIEGWTFFHFFSASERW